MADARHLTYSSYLRLPELLALQTPRSDEHDELLFVVIHQVYELWFKQVLHELDHVVALLRADEPARAGHTLGRVLRILKVLVSQLDVLETMTPLEFLSFRDRLDAASGFQSDQFREVEALLGLEVPTGADRPAVAVRRAAPSLFAELLAHLGRAGFPCDPADLASVEDALVAVYRAEPATSELLERFVDLDEGLQEWRYRHLKMVQRTIGTRVGTGGSAGAEHLARTLRPAFPALWSIRTRL